MPALMIRLPGKVSPVLKSVVPQSPQNDEVILFPESAVFEISFGVPERTSSLVRDFETVEKGCARRIRLN